MLFFNKMFLYVKVEDRVNLAQDNLPGPDNLKFSCMLNYLISYLNFKYLEYIFLSEIFISYYNIQCLIHF